MEDCDRNRAGNGWPRSSPDSPLPRSFGASSHGSTCPWPGGDRPRTYYEMLGIGRNERDRAVIEGAALHRTCLVRPYQLTRELECTRQLNEIALALSTLLDPARRREYDRGLSAGAVRTGPEREVPQIPSQPIPCPRDVAFAIVISDGENCEVMLVCRRSCRRAAGRRTG
jgi:hypothetical protein